MGHPLTPDLSKLSQEDLTKKYNDLMARFTSAYRMGKPDMVYQLQLLIQDYKEEISRREQKALEEMQKQSGNFKGIIDIK